MKVTKVEIEHIENEDAIWVRVIRDENPVHGEGTPDHPDVTNDGEPTGEPDEGDTDRPEVWDGDEHRA